MKELIPRAEFHGIIDHPGSASVLGFNSNQEILLIETQKANIPFPVFEIPGGVCESKETPEQSARRELEEETGYSFDQSEFCYLITPSVGYSNEWISVFSAFVFKREEQSEFEPLFFSREQVAVMIREGRIVDAQSLAALSGWIAQNQSYESANTDVLFLCTGNYYRSRFCELYFNQLNQDTRLNAHSRGLWAYRKINPGFISPHTIDFMKRLNIPLGPLRFPEQQELRHFETAKRIIALDESEHRPMMEEMFPNWAHKIEYWQVHDIDFTEPTEALASLKSQVEALSIQMNEL